MITIKDAYRYQNKIGGLMDYVERYMRNANHLVKTQERHLKGKALAGMTDEVVDTPREPDDYRAEDIMRFGLFLLSEKEKLDHAVYAGKQKLHVEVDGAVSANQLRRQLASCLLYASNTQGTSRLQKNGGKGYMLNKDNNPTQYVYDIELVTTIDFDRKKMKKTVKALFEEAESASDTIERALMEKIVDYTPVFDLNDTIENIVEEFISAA